MIVVLELSIFSILFFSLLFLCATYEPHQAPRIYTIITLLLLALILSVIPFYLSEMDNLLASNGVDVKKITQQLLFFSSKSRSLANYSTSQPTRNGSRVPMAVAIRTITRILSNSGQGYPDGASLRAFEFYTFWEAFVSLIHQFLTITNFFLMISLFLYNAFIGVLICKAHLLWGILYGLQNLSTFYSFFPMLILFLCIAVFFNWAYIPFFIVFQVMLSVLVFFHYGEKKWTDGRFEILFFTNLEE